MAYPRSYTDDQLREAVAVSLCWADVMEALGKSRKQPPGHTQKVASRLGLDYSHFDYGYKRARKPIEAPESDFTGEATYSGRIGLTIAMRWFLSHGYNVSLPVEVAHYNLIAKSNSGLKKVQVKTTAKISKGGTYHANIGRMQYNPDGILGSHGRASRVAYLEEEIDLFFIATSDGQKYLIPLECVPSATVIALDTKYRNFRVE